MIYAFGAFDGFHRGHAELLRTAMQLAQTRGESWGVATFDSNPHLLFGEKNFRMLFSNAERDLFAKVLSVPVLLRISFTKEIASLLPSDFIQYMTKNFDMTGLVVGENFRFGKNRVGDTNFIKNYCMKHDLAAKIVPSVTFTDVMLSSTLIRSFVSEGKVKDARELLGLPYFIRQTVVRGEQRGRKLGFPTANLCCEKYKLYPAAGSYITVTITESKAYPSVTNIGFNPTFEGKKQTCETHIINFKGDIYGKTLTLLFLERNREETKFENQKQLIKQLSLDVKAAEKIANLYIQENSGLINKFCSFDRLPLL